MLLSSVIIPSPSQLRYLAALLASPGPLSVPSSVTLGDEGRDEALTELLHARWVELCAGPGGGPYVRPSPRAREHAARIALLVDALR